MRETKYINLKIPIDKIPLLKQFSLKTLFLYAWSEANKKSNSLKSFNSLVNVLNIANDEELIFLMMDVAYFDLLDYENDKWWSENKNQVAELLQTQE